MSIKVNLTSTLNVATQKLNQQQHMQRNQHQKIRGHQQLQHTTTKNHIKQPAEKPLWENSFFKELKPRPTPLTQSLFQQ